jgi:hypothetical protein
MQIIKHYFLYIIRMLYNGIEQKIIYLLIMVEELI